MEFKNDPIADQATSMMRTLEKQGVKINGGSEYNRVFEAFYELYKKISTTTTPIQEESEDELWNQVAAFITGSGAFSLYPDYMQELKKSFTIKRK